MIEPPPLPNRGGVCWANALTQCLRASGVGGFGMGYEACARVCAGLPAQPYDACEALLQIAEKGALPQLKGVRETIFVCACGAEERRASDGAVDPVVGGERPLTAQTTKLAASECESCGAAERMEFTRWRDPPAVHVVFTPCPPADFGGLPLASARGAVLRKGSHYYAMVRQDAQWWTCDDGRIAATPADAALALVRRLSYLVFF